MFPRPRALPQALAHRPAVRHLRRQTLPLPRALRPLIPRPPRLGKTRQSSLQGFQLFPLQLIISYNVIIFFVWRQSI